MLTLRAYQWVTFATRFTKIANPFKLSQQKDSQNDYNLPQIDIFLA